MANNKPSTKRIALIIAVISAVITDGLILAIDLGDLIEVTWLLYLVPVVVAPAIYFMLQFTLRRFIRKQMKPLYRTVNEMSLKKAVVSHNHAGDLFSEVDDEVRYWAEMKKKEVEKLKDLERYRKDFLGNVYHELKTPIFNIQGYILTLIEGGIKDKSINKLYLERTEKNINRMISIVEDLETISRLESGALNLNIEKFNIAKTIEEVVEVNEMRASSRNITLATKMAEGREYIVSADRKRVFQVVNNLVVNSINYGKERGKTIISLNAKGDRVTVAVEDNGIGISKSDRKRVFERFYRVDKSRSRDTGGTGLGLAIVKHIVEGHGSKVRLTSEPGKGSRFSFSLNKG